jgi:nitrogen fixation/metabolism regulation signal transduction histidine kinase
MALRIPGKTERRLALAILLTAVVPLAAALYLASSLFRQAAALWFNPEVGQQLDRGVDLYKDYVKAIKDDMRHQTDAIAADEVLREAAKKRNVELIEAQLDALFPRFPELVALHVEDTQGTRLASRDRGRPVNTDKEKSLEVRRALSDDGPQVVATFAVDRRRLDELETAGSVVARYHQLEASREKLYEGYFYAFGALLGITMLMALLLGIVLARGVTRRINRLALASSLVAEGDLSVRVPITGSDELTELARTFNRMLGEMNQSRARIEFLQNIGAWQEMAQRLAHEIKNPLTPIQLAVQECHRKYEGDDPKYRALLDTTREIVEEEVGTLRRLVGNFSNFARLPHAELKESSLRDFLRECSEQLGHLEDVTVHDDDGLADQNVASVPHSLKAKKTDASVDVRWNVPSAELPALIDRQMLRRVLVNLVRNAGQAIRDDRARKGGTVKGVLGHVEVTATREGEGSVIVVEDDGPGVRDDMRARIFDPYFTTKDDGTGLGLAIVKKIVVEHGGSIEVKKSEKLGGAKFVVHLPAAKAMALAAAAREARESQIRLENIMTERRSAPP